MNTPIDENEDIIHQWEPLNFKITEKYKYVPKNIIYKFFSFILYYIIYCFSNFKYNNETIL